MRKLLWILLIITLPMILFMSYTLGEQANWESPSSSNQMIGSFFYNEPHFTPALLYEALLQVGIQNSEIVFRQSILETGWFESSSFKDYHNPFGMKQPKYRETLCTGTALGHGSFDHWYDAVKDYKIWQDYWLDTIYTPTQYYHFLDTLPYAEAKRYTYTLKRIDISDLLPES